MKYFVIAVVLVALVGAEPPPSKSYLPPSPNSNGYPSGGPEIVAARSFNQGGVQGFGSLNRNGNQGLKPQARFGAASQQDFTQQARFGAATQPDLTQQARIGAAFQPGFTQQPRFGAASQPGYTQQAGLFGRNALEDQSSEPAKYNFGYTVTDDYDGTDFGHHEHREDKKAEGEYHVVLPDGKKQTVSYKADENGFKPRISYEDANGGNGYNENGPQNGGFGNARAKGGY